MNIAGMAGAPGRFVRVATHRLHFRGAGSGSPVVVFDAALGGSSLSWSLVQTDISAVTLTCAYDRAGFGWSDRGPLPRTAGRIADELHQMLVAAEIPPPCVLVGHSFGGMVMRLLAARHPEVVAALVLIEPAHPEDWIDPSPEQRQTIERGARLCRHGAVAARLGVARVVSMLVGAGALPAARALVKAVSRGGLRREDEGVLAPVWKLPPEVRATLKNMWSQPKFFEALGSQIESICVSAAETAREADRDYGDIPLAVMTGSGASPRRLQADAALARFSRRGRHVLVPDTGHWIPLDAPQAVTDVVVETVRLVRSLQQASASRP